MATLHLMVGLPGSGKTTEAKRLAASCHALRLTPDEWQLRLFGNDFYNDESKDQAHHTRHAAIEALMWDTARELLLLGTDVILDFGCWARAERDDFRAKAHALGADFQIHSMVCPAETLWARLEKRNKTAGRDVFPISRESLDAWVRIFEPPTEDELA